MALKCSLLAGWLLDAAIISAEQPRSSHAVVVERLSAAVKFAISFQELLKIFIVFEFDVNLI